MVEIIVVVREVGRSKPEYSLKFNVPAVPQIGSYLSIQRPDKPKPFGEDLVVRDIWWRLNHPETRTTASDEREKVGQVNEIFVECEQALTPYSSDQWRDSLEAARARGVHVETIASERFSFRESDLKR